MEAPTATDSDGAFKITEAPTVLPSSTLFCRCSCGGTRASQITLMWGPIRLACVLVLSV
jgi:hypothetical protein